MVDVQRLTQRQKALLIIIEQFEEGIAREELSELLAAGFPVSRATVIRELNVLLEQGLIHTSGKGPATLYMPRAAGELLKYYDLPAYFNIEPDERPLTNQSVEEFLSELKTNQLIFEEEQEELSLENKKYQERLKTREPSILKREQERFTAELAWKSSKIEGNTYSLLETEELLKTTKEAPGHTSEEAQMILNHKKALELISANASDYHTLSSNKVVQMHAILTSGLGISEGIRSQAVGITGTTYQPPADEKLITEYLAAALEIANKKEHPLEAAIIISALIAYLQPFSDGNKRTARLIANAVLIAHDYAPLSYRSVNEIVYKESVLLVDEQHSLYWYKKLFLEQFMFTCHNYFT